MTTVSLGGLRSRLYEAYASQHAGSGGGESAALACRRDIRPLLPSPAAGPVIDLGCGRGELVRLLQTEGFDAEGIDISPEQTALARAAGVAQVRQGDSPPVAHGLASAARVMVWQVVSDCYRIALAAETGVLRGQIVTQNLTFAARKGAELANPEGHDARNRRDDVSGRRLLRGENA